MHHWFRASRPRATALGAALLVLLAGNASAVSYRWSAGSYRIYVTGPGTATLSDVKAGMPNAPLAQISPGVWHLRANLVMENGARLLLHGSKIGGDVNQLRLQSNNTGESNAFIHVTADWGSIDIRSTSITSWDDAANGPDTESGPMRRAFIRVRSSLDDKGVPRESRMDIVDSDIGYLGSHDAEAYGLVWKVIDTHSPAVGTLTNLYNLVNVYGDILDSRIHHCFFGMYSFGAYGMRMMNNELDNNVGYGFDPHDDSDYLLIENNNVHHNGWHGIIASQRCNNVIVRDNTSWANGKNGIMLHRYCNDSIIENNRCLDNGDSGIALFDNSRTVVRNNLCLRNGNAGIRMSVGAADNLIENNEFGNGANYGIYLYQGGDLPFPGDDGHPKRNRFIANRVHQNAGHAILITTADDNVFAGNFFEANALPPRFLTGLRNIFESNSMPREVPLVLQGLPGLPSTATVRNQSALLIDLDLFSTATFTDTSGHVFDPDEQGLPSTAGTAETKLILTGTEIAKTSVVQTRNLQVTPDTGSVKVTLTAWDIPGNLSKRWNVQAGSGTKRITYRVGDLTPNTEYEIWKNGVEFGQFDADSKGVLTFTDTKASQAVARFEVLQ
jgi:parallel beta-helix repeat protein